MADTAKMRRPRRRFTQEFRAGAVRLVLDNVTPADVYAGRRPTILAPRERIKRRTLAQRKRETLCTPRRTVNRQDVSLTKQADWSGLI